MAQLFESPEMAEFFDSLERKKIKLILDHVLLDELP